MGGLSSFVVAAKKDQCRSCIFKRLLCEVNGRLMKLRRLISSTRLLTFISTYAPALTSSDEGQEKF